MTPDWPCVRRLRCACSTISCAHARPWSNPLAIGPDKHLPADAAEIGETTGEEPPEHDVADRPSVTMRPGDQLWSHALTPHWVTTESALAMRVILSHGGLSHQGRFSERELALRAYWDKNPSEAWMHDLRNVRY